MVARVRCPSSLREFVASPPELVPRARRPSSLPRLVARVAARLVAGVAAQVSCEDRKPAAEVPVRQTYPITPFLLNFRVARVR